MSWIIEYKKEITIWAKNYNRNFLTNFEKLQTNYVAIKDLEAKRADLDKEIEGYLKELGLVE